MNRNEKTPTGDEPTRACETVSRGGGQSKQYQKRALTSILNFHRKQNRQEPCPLLQALLLPESDQAAPDGTGTPVTLTDVRTLRVNIAEKIVDDRVFLTGMKACEALAATIREEGKP